jgi:hypothetical protein
MTRISSIIFTAVLSIQVAYAQPTGGGPGGGGPPNVPIGGVELIITGGAILGLIRIMSKNQKTPHK